MFDLTQGALVESGQLLGAGEKQAVRKRNRAGSGARRRVPAPIAPSVLEEEPLVEKQAKGAELLNSAEAGYAELKWGG